MTELNWFGYWATFFLLASTWLTIKKDSKGWLLRLFGSLIWAWIGLRIHLASLWMSELVFAGMAFVGFMDWWIEEDAAERHEKYETWSNPKDICDPLTAEEILKELRENWDENVKCESEGQDLATKRSSSRAKKVQPARRRRGKQTDGKRRSRPNAKQKGARGARRNVRVQKDNRRTNTRRPKASRA